MNEDRRYGSEFVSRFLRYREWLDAARPEFRGSPKPETYEITLVTDMMRAHKAEQNQREALNRRGIDTMHGRIGLLYEDAVCWLVNDPVLLRKRLPDGTMQETLRTWWRVCWKNVVRGRSVAFIPITEDGRVLMIPAPRHVSQRCELEFPGGGVEGAKDDASAVNAELFEETGYEVLSMIPLERERPVPGFVANVSDQDQSFFYPDPSTNAAPLTTFVVRLGRKQDAQPEDGETVGDPVLLSPKDVLRAMVLGGTIERPGMPGVRMHVRCGRNAYLLLQAFAQNYLSFEPVAEVHPVFLARNSQTRK